MAHGPLNMYLGSPVPSSAPTAHELSSTGHLYLPTGLRLSPGSALANWLNVNGTPCPPGSNSNVPVSNKFGDLMAHHFEDWEFAGPPKEFLKGFESEMNPGRAFLITEQKDITKETETDGVKKFRDMMKKGHVCERCQMCRPRG